MNALHQMLEGHPLPAPAGAKDDRGTIVLLGGPAECPGAVLLAAEAALRSGVGRLHLGVHPSVTIPVAVAVPEASVDAWVPGEPPSDVLRRRLARADATVVGPGYADDLRDAVLVLAAEGAASPLVLDAGALPAAPDLAETKRLVLAPNTEEASRLADGEGTEADLAVRLGKDLACPVAVRGSRTAITDGAGSTWSYETEATGLGTPGSGDVLIGVLAALLARGVPGAAALGWAVALHGRAGEIAERSMLVGYLARDVLTHLPAAFAELGAA